MQYQFCDATIPLKKRSMIIHICNDQKIWGAGFVLALEKRYPKAKEAYLQQDLALSDVQFVQVEEQILVANMVAQKGIIGPDNPHPIDYDALDQCLQKVFEKAQNENYAIQMPQIGVGLAGGDWEIIKTLIQKHQNHVPCTVCLLKDD